MPLFTNTQLSNEDYHALPEIGGSSLVVIHNDCPAAWKYGERPPSKALVDGIAAHVCVLEPSLFAERFVRGIDPAEHDDALFTVADLNGYLKSVGRDSGLSGKKKEFLIKMILDADPDVKIFDDMVERHAEENKDKVIVKPKDFDMINAMRGAIFRQQKYAHMLSNTNGRFDLQFETSFISPSGLKCRWDCITADGEIVDYKTCQRASSKKFGVSAAENGYWLKMALQHDLFVEAFGERPKKVTLLAQGKAHPYIPQDYFLTEEQLRVGREKYNEAFDIYKRCLDLNEWYGYSADGESLPLYTPGYLAFEYGMEEEVEIEYE